MNTDSPHRRPLRSLSKALFVALGGTAILLAVALGVFRLLVAQIPSYQTELRDWVAAELGFAVEFAVLDARLGLRGPELTLRQATIGSGREFLEAEQATITLDPFALVFSRQIDVSRLTLDGVRLTVERDARGAFRLGDFELASGPDQGQGLASIPDSVEVAIRQSELVYLDSIREREWRFDDLDLVIESTDGGYRATASLNPPEALAERVELELELSLPTTDEEGMRLRAAAGAEVIDLATLVTLIPADRIPAVDGSGAAEVEIEWTRRELTAFRFAVDATSVDLATGDDRYDQLRVSGNWRRLDSGDWSLRLDDIFITRSGRDWEPDGSLSLEFASDTEGVESISLEAGFLRLGDLEPLVSVFPVTQLADQWSLFEPGGDVRALDFSLDRRNESFDYDLDVAFDAVTLNQVGAYPGVEGISGAVQATEDSGTIELDTAAFGLDWPALFDRPVAAESLNGEVIWRQSLDAINIVSAYLGVGILGREARASFNLELPHDGSSPVLDITAELESVELVGATQYLPRPVIPDEVVSWLDQAIVGGEARDIEFTLSGPLRSFPFDGGGGQFHVAADVENVALDYMLDWPRADNINGWIEFANAGFLAGASGEVLGNRTENFELAIPDMRDPTLSLAVVTNGTLADVVAYLRGAPLVAERLGPGFERLEVADGAGSIDARLDLPLQNLSAFALDAALTIEDGVVAFRGLRPPITELEGIVRAREDSVFADDVEGVFAGGPISAALTRSSRQGFRAELVIDGETSVGSIMDAFELPQTELIDGQALWRGRLLLPVLDPLATMPTQFTLESNLAGVALRFPEPMAKPPGEPVNLAVDLRFLTGNRVEVAGNLGATRRFALGLTVDGDALRFVRGAVEFGGGEPRLPVQAGIRVGGQIGTLELDPWLALGSTAGIGQAGPLFLGAEVDIASLNVFGQQLGTTSLRIGRNRDDWAIDIDSEAIAGEISIPRGVEERATVVANMSRVYLAAAGGEGGLTAVNPRSLPGLQLQAAEFGFGNRQFGNVVAVVEPVVEGVVLTEFTSQTENFETQLSGSWLGDPSSSRTTLNAEIRSADVAAALAELGLDPVVDGESAAVTARVFWDSAPTAAWLDHLHGDVSLTVETGTLREVDPGAGRVVGLMSIAALPRRLALDFRDVFEEGFAFDEITGNFTLIDGNAYTNDLKFGGPAAEIGVLGRTGLRDRDYRQQVVVTAEPGNMLPTVGGLLGGAGVGAALLIFTRLFKEQLAGIGRASYCLSGSWEAPTVELIEDDESAAAELCAELPEAMRTVVSDE